MADSEKETVLFFESAKSLPEFEATGFGDNLEKFTVKVKDLIKWFEDYKVEKIELSVKGVVETGVLTKLIIGAKGEAGVTITLVPNKN